MKKISLVVLCVVTIGLLTNGCTKNDTNNSTFNPPDWIIGTWDNKSEQAFLSTYIFTEDNALLVNINGETTDYTKSFANSEATVTEPIITEETYKYIVKHSFKDMFGVDETQLTYKKISETEISCENSLADNLSYYVRVD